jgi:hypothetical protein
MSHKTDLILLQAHIKKEDARALLGRLNTKELIKKVMVSYRAWAPMEQAPDQPGLLHLYLKLDKPRRLNKRDIHKIEQRWIKISKLPDSAASRLCKVFESAGASTGQTAYFHYVVETTPEKGWFKELSQWYDQEHMPGLASVAGCVHTVRMLNLDHGPKSLACYDLVEKSVMGSPDWLKIRNSEWSSRCRPHFTKTKRNMFEVLES